MGEASCQAGALNLGEDQIGDPADGLWTLTSDVARAWEWAAMHSDGMDITQRHKKVAWPKGTLKWKCAYAEFMGTDNSPRR